MVKIFLRCTQQHFWCYKPNQIKASPKSLVLPYRKEKSFNQIIVYCQRVAINTQILSPKFETCTFAVFTLDLIPSFIKMASDLQVGKGRPYDENKAYV